MLPVILSPHGAKIGLAGAGEGFSRRKALLEQSGVMEPVSIAWDATDSLAGLWLLFVAGVPSETAVALATHARAAGVLVNVEDVPELCDFHVPATVRRGDLLLTVSTGGKAPGLAKLIREWLDSRFGSEWPYRIDHLAHRRAQWRTEGDSPSDVSRRTRAFVEERRWL